MTQKLKHVAVTAATSVGALAASAGSVMANNAGDTQVGSLTVPGGFFPSFGALFSDLLSFVLTIGALLVFMYLIWGGIEWITSGGDKGKTESARNKITAAVIGLIVLAASFAILQITLSVLGLDPATLFSSELLE